MKCKTKSATAIAFSTFSGNYIKLDLAKNTTFDFEEVKGNKIKVYKKGIEFLIPKKEFEEKFALGAGKEDKE